MKYTLSVCESADEDVRKIIVQQLLQFNERAAGPSGHQTLVVAIRDETQAVVGGLWGVTSYQWLYTQMLVVPEALRGQGVGAALVGQAERTAWQRGCRNAWVDTQFGARGFYEKLGYTCFGELGNYPAGFSRVFLQKALASE